MEVAYVIYADYADDINLLDFSHDRMQKMIEAVETNGKQLGLLLKKCKGMLSNNREDTAEIRIDSNAI